RDYESETTAATSPAPGVATPAARGPPGVERLGSGDHPGEGRRVEARRSPRATGRCPPTVGGRGSGAAAGNLTVPRRGSAGAAKSVPLPVRRSYTPVAAVGREADLPTPPDALRPPGRRVPR